MKTVGIRELKAQLSRVLREVGAGEVFLVTDRGRVVTELKQPEFARTGASAEQRALSQLSALGQLRVAERAAPQYKRSKLKSRSGLARELLEAERGE